MVSKRNILKDFLHISLGKICKIPSLWPNSTPGTMIWTTLNIQYLVKESFNSCTNIFSGQMNLISIYYFDCSMSAGLRLAHAFLIFRIWRKVIAIILSNRCPTCGKLSCYSYQLLSSLLISPVTSFKAVGSYTLLHLF